MEPISHNDIVRYQKLTMHNDNVTGKKLEITHLQVDEIADYLVEQFQSEKSREFYCKAAMRIPRARLDYLVTQAKETGKTPGALFNFLARKELGEL